MSITLFKSQEIRGELGQLNSKKHLIPQWIPSHCNNAGNDKAERLSERGSHLDQPHQSVSYSEMKAILRYRFHQAWKSRPEVETEEEDLQCLGRS